MRIIHFSDFHLDADHLERSESIINNMISALKDIHQEKTIDIIIFSGDLIDKAGKGFPKPKMATGFKKFSEIVIEPITSALGLAKNRFVYTLGNHDVDQEAETSIENAKLTRKLSSPVEVDRFMDEKDVQKKIPRTREYNKFRDHYWKENRGDAEIHYTPFQLAVKIKMGDMKVGINLLNTAWRCYNSKTDKGKLLLGKQQITKEKDFFKDCSYRFAVGHHSPSFLKEYESKSIEGLLASNYDAYFCGHTHDNDAVMVTRPQGSCIYFIAPGTLTWNISEESHYQNGFMLIDYEPSKLIVKTQSYYQELNEDFVKNNNFAESGEWIIHLSGSTIIKTMESSLFLQKRDSEFLQNDVIVSCIEELKDENNKAIQFVALSGLGKTRIIREAFDDNIKHKNYYYCEYSGLEDSLQYDVDALLSSHIGEKGLLVLDNCPNRIIESVILKRKSYGSLFRIIGINNDYSERNEIRSGIAKQVILNQDLLREKVNQYIDEKVPVINGDTNPRDQIKRISDGFPGMAIQLVKAYQEEKSLDVHLVDHLVKKLLKFDNTQNKDEEIAMRSMALFQPCPYRGAYADAFRFIRNNENMTPLFRKSEIEKRHIFSNAITKHNSSLIEISECWLNVRPFPLAIWLVDKWFEDNNDEETIAEMVHDIESLEKPLYEVIKDGLTKRLTYMQYSIPAQELATRLFNGPAAPFRNEKVVCSDLGSRLFLAMSSVNPGAVAKCLSQILLPKDLDWIKEHISGDVRRNHVWALEKLCFSKNSYRDASKVMALLAVAENEKWGNNATGQFKQLFHIFLPGTESNLSERFETLEYLHACGEEYEELLFDCIDRAFDNGHFVRDGHAAQFGIEKKEDYCPSNKEIINYWMACSDMLQRLIDEDNHALERISKIVVGHYARWTFDGMLESLFPLLIKIADKKGGEWPELYDTMIGVTRRKKAIYTDEFMQRLEAFTKEIKPKHFYQKLKDTRQIIFNDYHTPVEKQLQKEKELFEPLAKEFLDKGFYKDYNEVERIASDTDYLDMWFSQALFQIMNNEQIRELLSVFLRLIETGEKDIYRSNFMFRFCSVFKMNSEVRSFMREILDKGYQDLFMRLLSHCETESYDSYEEMKNLCEQGMLEPQAPTSYLVYVSVPYVHQLGDIIKFYHKDYPELVMPLMAFVLRHMFDKELLKDAEVLAIVKQLALNCSLEEDVKSLGYQYASYVRNLLEDFHDDEFALSMCRKMIDGMSKGFIHSDLDGIFSRLIKNYTDVIWPDFEKVFQNRDSVLFIFQIKSEIGSGSGFGAGPLFQIDETRVKNLCLKYPDCAPHYIAEMVPVFHYSDDENDKDLPRFHNWVLWLLDKFGDHEDVLDGLNSNFGTYGWSGSIIPLLIKKKVCFEKLRKHKYTEVRKWAEVNIQSLNSEISRERNRDEYMRLQHS